MNSRDAAFDENLKEVLEATAAEAGTAPDSTPTMDTSLPLEQEEPADYEPPIPKKRRRSEAMKEYDDSLSVHNFHLHQPANRFHTLAAPRNAPDPCRVPPIVQ